MKYNAYSSTAYNSTTSGIYANPRTITASIVVNGSTTYTQQNIKTFKIDSTPVNGKWFGISYSQQLSVTFIDPDKSITINRGDSIKVSLICNGCTVAYPTYFVDSSNRDEKTGELTAVGFDIMAKANNLTFALGDNWTGGYVDLCNLCATALGTTCAVVGEPSSSIPSQIWTKETVNIPADGYSLRDMITAIAEAGGRFAYINSQDKLIFRMVTNNASSEIDSTANFVNAPVKIDKTRYFELTTDKQCTLTGITHKNELNDTVSVGTSTGINQVIYDNPLMSGLKDTTGGSTKDQKIQALLNNILNNIYITVTPFSMSWRGNMACEIGDTVWTAEKGCSTLADSWVYNSTPGVIWDCFYLSETVEYNGGVRGTIQWEYQPSENVTVGPTNVSTSSRITRATVDKANNNIQLLVGEVWEDGQIGPSSRIDINQQGISSLVTTTNGMQSSITQNAENISLVVEGPTGSTPASIKIGNIVDAINNGPTSGSSAVIIDADHINLQGVTTFVKPGDNISELTNDAGYIDNADLSGYATKSGLATTNYTTINGGNITTGNIKSSGYIGPTGTSKYSTAGTEIALDNGTIITPYFYTGPSGAGFKGDISASTGTISGNRIASNSITADKIDTTNLKVQYVEPLNATDDQTYIHADDAGIEIYAHKISGGQYVNNLILQGDNLYLTAENKIVIDDTAYGSTLPVSNLSEGRIFFKLSS